MTDQLRDIEHCQPPTARQTRAGKLFDHVNLELATAASVLLAAFCADTGYASSRVVNVLFIAVCAAFSIAFGQLVRGARVKGRQQAHFLSFLLLCSVMIVFMPAYYRSTETGGILLGMGSWLIALFSWQALSRQGALVWLALPLAAAASFASPWLALAFIPLFALSVLMNTFYTGKTRKNRSKRFDFSTVLFLAVLFIGYASIWVCLLLRVHNHGGTLFDFPNIPLSGLLIRTSELLPLFAVIAVIYIKAIMKAGSIRHRVWLLLAMLSPLLIAGSLVFTDCLSGMAAGETIGRYQQLPLVVSSACAAACFGFLLSSLASGDSAVEAAAGEVSLYFKQRPAVFLVLAAYIIKTTLTGGVSEWIFQALAE